jgi:hypothetical protein
VTREISFLPILHYLWCIARRSLHVITKVYYKSMSCFAMVSRTNGPACSAKVSYTNVPSCTMWEKRFTKYDAIPGPTEQDILTTVFLISRKVIPYRTRGGTCYPAMSTPKIRSLANLSTTCHDGINHLDHFNHSTNDSIDPHMVTMHLDEWKTTTLSQTHKPTHGHK